MVIGFSHSTLTYLEPILISLFHAVLCGMFFPPLLRLGIRAPYFKLPLSNDDINRHRQSNSNKEQRIPKLDLFFIIIFSSSHQFIVIIEVEMQILMIGWLELLQSMKEHLSHDCEHLIIIRFLELQFIMRSL